MVWMCCYCTYSLGQGRLAAIDRWLPYTVVPLDRWLASLDRFHCTHCAVLYIDRCMVYSGLIRQVPSLVRQGSLHLYRRTTARLA